MATGGDGTSVSGCGENDSSVSGSESEDWEVPSGGAAGGSMITGVGRAGDVPGCKKHSGNPVIAFCETCQESVCCDCCTDAKHTSHKLVSLKEHLERVEKTVKSTGPVPEALVFAKEKQEKIKDLKKRVQTGHKKERKAVKAKERVVLESLQLKFDREVQVLEDTLRKQSRQVQKLSRDKTEVIRSSCEVQMRRLDEAQKAVDAAISSLQAATNVQDTDDSAADVLDLKSVEVVSGEMNLQDFTTLDNFPAAVQVSIDTKRVVSTSSTTPSAGKGSSTSPGMCAVIPAERVPYLKSRIASLTPQDVAKCGSYGAGYVVITRDYHVSCRQFADGKTDVFPGPLQCSDPSSLYNYRNDVTFLPPGDAAALCAVVGGKPDVTVASNFTFLGRNHTWVYDNNIMFRCTNLYDVQGNALKIPGKMGDYPHQCSLPARDTFHNSLEKYLGYYPSVVKEKNSTKVIDHSVTVGAWKGDSDNPDLTVIK